MLTALGSEIREFNLRFCVPYQFILMLQKVYLCISCRKLHFYLIWFQEMTLFICSPNISTLSFNLSNENSKNGQAIFNLHQNVDYNRKYRSKGIARTCRTILNLNECYPPLNMLQKYESLLLLLI